jgi:hypothetical protein
MLSLISVIIIVSLYFYRKNTHNERIEKRDKEIAVQEIVIDSLENLNELYVDSLKDIINDIGLFVDTVNHLKLERIEIRKDYERKIAAIVSIPADSLYLEVTRWLDER